MRSFNLSAIVAISLLIVTCSPSTEQKTSSEKEENSALKKGKQDDSKKKRYIIYLKANQENSLYVPMILAPSIKNVDSVKAARKEKIAKVYEYARNHGLMIVDSLVYVDVTTAFVTDLDPPQ